MPKFKVTVEITRKVVIYASDEHEAKEKAEKVVMDWKDVENVDAIDAEEDDD